MLNKFVILLSSFLFSFTPNKTEDCLRLDIILIGDTSDSVKGYEYFIDSAFISFVDKFEMINQDIRISVIQFSDSANVLCHLTSDKAVVKKSLDKFKEKAYGGTNMISAFWSALREFKSNGRLDVKKVIVIVSDGEPNKIIETVQVADKLHDSDIDICGVLVVKNNADDDGSYLPPLYQYSTRENYNPEFMKRISSEFCYVESNFQNLKKKLMKLSICL